VNIVEMSEKASSSRLFAEPRLPVGASAKIMAGRPTMARATAT